jgi:hypothetical protein
VQNHAIKTTKLMGKMGLREKHSEASSTTHFKKTGT